MDKELMPKVDFKKDKLTDQNIALMNQVEENNRERVRQLKKIRKSNRILGITLGLTTLSIYFYTMYTVKQERFLDDFNVPDPILETQSPTTK